MAGRVAAASLSCTARCFTPTTAVRSSNCNETLFSRGVRAFGTSSSRPFQAPLSSKSPNRSTSTVASFTVAAWGAREAMTELAPKSAPSGQEIATFAGGCFWGLELAYQREPGVAQTSVGYTQGSAEAPSYQAVCSGRTGHTEAVQVYYDPSETSYDRLLELFFERVDPTTKDRQGNDAGSQYRSGIYFHNDEQMAAAEKAIQAVNEKLKSNVFRRVLGSEVVTELKPAGNYWLAEQYHQQYLEKGGQNAAKGAEDRIRCYG